MEISVMNKKEYGKKYYIENKAYWYEKFTCDVCNGTYIRAYKSRHNITKKHLRAINIIKSNEDKKIEILDKEIELLNKKLEILKYTNTRDN